MAEKKDSIRSLIETGRRAGKLTNSEISDAMEESGHVLDVEQMEKLYEELESNGIEVIDDDPVSDVDASLLSGTTEEGADDFDDALNTDGITIDDPVKVYLKEIGRVPHQGLQVLYLRNVVDPSGHHPRHCRPGPHHPHPGAYGRDHQQGQEGLQPAAA